MIVPNMFVPVPVIIYVDMFVHNPVIIYVDMFVPNPVIIYVDMFYPNPVIIYVECRRKKDKIKRVLNEQKIIFVMGSEEWI